MRKNFLCYQVKHLGDVEGSIVKCRIISRGELLELAEKVEKG